MSDDAEIQRCLRPRLVAAKLITFRETFLNRTAFKTLR